MSGTLASGPPSAPTRREPEDRQAADATAQHILPERRRVPRDLRSGRHIFPSKMLRPEKFDPTSKTRTTQRRFRHGRSRRAQYQDYAVEGSGGPPTPSGTARAITQSGAHFVSHMSAR